VPGPRPGSKVEPVTDYAAANRAAYDVIARQYAVRWGGAPPWLVTELDELCGQLPAGARVADVGCGPGHHTQLLRERGMNASGFDLSYEMLTSAGTPGVVQADMQALPVADGAFDAVWSAAALLHIPRPSVPRVLGEFARILRPGGRLVLAVAEGKGERWEQVPYGIPGSEGVQRWYVFHGFDELSALIDAAGFDVQSHWRRATHRQWLHFRARLRAPDHPSLA
jgi:SAM-dependent methyltransferase